MSRKIPLYFYGYIFKENTVFFVDDTYNCLFQYDWQSEEVKFIHCFDELLKNLDYPLFGVDEITSCGDNIFLFSGGQNFIICFSISNKQEIVINMPQFQGKKIDIGRVITCGDKAWIFACDLAQGVYVLDMREKHIERDTALSKNVQKYSGSICEGINIPKKKIFLTALHGTGTILEVHFEDKKILEFNVPVSDLRLENVGYEGDIIYLVQMESSDVYEWNRKKNTVNLYSDSREKRVKDKCVNAYHDIICCDEGVYIVPWFGCEVLRLDRKGGCERIGIPLEILRYKPRKGMGIFCGFKMIENKMWSAPYGVNIFLAYDMHTRQILTKNVEVDLDYFPIHEQMIKRRMNPVRKCVVREDEQVSIYDLITFSQEGNNSKNKISNCGKMIYSKMSVGYDSDKL